MPPHPPSVSQEDWQRHEQTIKRLYHDEGLPLESESGRQSLMQVMRDEFNFTATPSQYERQLRKWSNGTSKNLKHYEWQLLIAQMDHLKSQHKTCRVKLSGRLIDNKRLKRARRRYGKPAVAGASAPAIRSAALAKCKHISIEIERQPGQWVDITSRANNTNESEIHLPTVLLERSPEADHLSSLEAPDTVLHAGSSDDLGFQAASTELDTPQFPLAAPPPPITLPLTGSYTNSCYRVSNLRHYQYDATLYPTSIYDILLLPSPFYQFHLLGRQVSDQTPVSHQRMHTLTKIRADPVPSSAALFFQTPQDFIESLIQDISSCHQQMSTLPKNSQAIFPSASEVIDDLESLLPPDTSQNLESPSAASTVVQGAQLDWRFPDILLYSVLNGFAGFRGVSAGSVFTLLRNNPQLNYQLFMKLSELEAASSSGKPLACSIARSLADNLFRAAVEACDPGAIRLISRAVEGGPSKIHPDDIVCELEDRLYTPLEFAAKKRDLECIQIIIALGADANKTYEQNFCIDRGPLEVALQKGATTFQPLDFRIVESLLEAGAQVRADLLGAVARRSPDSRIHKALIEKIQPNEHRLFFGHLPEQVAFLTNQLAMSLVEKLSNFCRETMCFQCIPSVRSSTSTPAEEVEDVEGAKGLENPDFAENNLLRTLNQAALQSNTKLCKFLLNYVWPDSLTLAAAIRGGDRDIVNLLAENGAGVHDPADELETREVLAIRPHARRTECTTPLAEAIRTRDNWFMGFVERLGSWQCLGRADHLVAAIQACVDVNDNIVLERLILPLKTMGLPSQYSIEYPREYLESFESALCLAIRGGSTPIVSMLLAAGVSVSGKPLAEALLCKNKDLVDLFLESDVDVMINRVTNSYGSIIELARQWGEASVITDLLDMGFWPDDSTMIGAVKAGNAELVDLLLKYGANPSGLFHYTDRDNSPLHAAVNKGDVNMVRHLLFAGANVEDKGAFLSAGEQRGEILDVLTTALTSKYPGGCKSFGADVLIKTIQSDDIALLDIFLAAKMDPHSFSGKGHVSCLVQTHKYTPLGAAIQHRGPNSMVAMQSLLGAGVNVESMAAAPYYRGGGFGNSVWPQQTALLEAIETRDEDKIKLILENGANINRTARRGLKRTPLQKACEMGSYSMVKLLLDRGAIANDVAAVRGGGTALQLASGTGSIRIVQLLFEKGADIDAPTSTHNGRSPLENAAENGCLDIVKILWDATNWVGFDPNEVNRATAFAREKGHRGCAQYIDELQAASQRRLIEVGNSIGLF